MQLLERQLHAEYRATTVLSVRKNNKVTIFTLIRLVLLAVLDLTRLFGNADREHALQVIIMADGQVTRNSEILKPNVKKVRSMFDGKVIGGFAGTMTLLAGQYTLLHFWGRDSSDTLQEQQQMLSRYLSALRRNWKKIQARIPPRHLKISLLLDRMPYQHPFGGCRAVEEVSCRASQAMAA